MKYAQLRAELDTYCDHLYGLTRDELRYILDPRQIQGEDFPGETFRAEGEGNQAVWGVQDEASRFGGVG